MRIRWLVSCIISISAMFPIVPASAQNPPSNRVTNLSFVAGKDSAWKQNMAGNSAILLRPGLYADQTGRVVRFWAEATGISGSTAIEFFLIDTSSGQDYETVAVSFAKPSDLHAALEFIGMVPGRPYEPSMLQFWPRGERVIAHAAWQTEGHAHRVRLENLCYDLKRKSPLPAQGLIFTGSQRIPSRPATNNYAADVFSPNAIAGVFNESSLVLDVPWQANQSEIYGQIVANPDAVPPRGTMLEITVEPEFRNGRLRVAPLDLHISPGTNDAAATLKNLRFTLTDKSAAKTTPSIMADGALPALLSQFEHVSAAGRDPFVTLKFDDTLPVNMVRTVAEFINTIDNVNGIRIESPPPGHPYYKSFCPPDTFRNRAERPSQPWELRLSTNSTTIGVLTQVTEAYDAKLNQSTFTTRDFPIATVTELQTILQSHEWPKVIFIYAAASIPYRRITLLFKTISPTHPTIYVFVD